LPPCRRRGIGLPAKGWRSKASNGAPPVVLKLWNLSASWCRLPPQIQQIQHPQSPTARNDRWETPLHNGAASRASNAGRQKSDPAGSERMRPRGFQAPGLFQNRHRPAVVRMSPLNGFLRQAPRFVGFIHCFEIRGAHGENLSCSPPVSNRGGGWQPRRDGRGSSVSIQCSVFSTPCRGVVLNVAH